MRVGGGRVFAGGGGGGGGGGMTSYGRLLNDETDALWDKIDALWDNGGDGRVVTAEEDVVSRRSSKDTSATDGDCSGELTLLVSVVASKVASFPINGGRSGVVECGISSGS